MDNDTKILLMAVVIILVALVSFNLSDLTGKVIGTKSTVIITPERVSEGGVITVKIIPGLEGVYNRYAWVYRKGTMNDIRVQGTSKRVCEKESTCYDPVIITYKLHDELKSGTYYVKVREKDRYNTIYAQDSFQII